ncbi:class I fructose-bisphosphate aldolase [Catenuloplanes sp. NPDC051500]|uniref:class I fructose-bisphosphate aldolase n=1 Tax=Catenuloplanes sp. NPDC051500 TaxID=3363959 RepID=UPI0037A6B8EC
MHQPPGLQRRMHRILPPGRPALWLPLDDGLISGPEHHLHDVRGLLTADVVPQLTAVLGFRGVLAAASAQLVDTPVVMNLSASTTLHEHTRKAPVGTVADAVRAGADAIACHVNISSPSETEALEQLARRVTEADEFGLPVVAMIYPRSRNLSGTDNNHLRMRRNSPERFAELVRHCARIGMELGASAIKTMYTGTPETFRTVVESAMGVPVLIAGEALVDASEALERAQGAVAAGAAGVAYGRQIFNRDEAGPFVAKLRAALDDV